MKYEPFYCTDTTTVDDVIEHILIRLNDDFAGGCLDVSEFCHRNQKGYTDLILDMQVRTKLYEHQVAKRCDGYGQPDTAVALTAKGSQFSQKDSWKRYLDSLRQVDIQQQTDQMLERQRQHEAHQATLTSAKATEDSARLASSSAKAAWFSGVVGAAAILISLYQLYKGNEVEDKLNAVTKRAESTDSLLKVIQQNQTTHKQQDNRVSSDSLVRPVAPESGRKR